MNSGERVGVYGGTFDPIHLTHLDIARAARAHASLDRILFVVTADPPHKRGEVFTDAKDRLAMVECALEEEPGMEASRLEMDRNGPSYTADTLQQLHTERGNLRLHLVIGLDSLVDLADWYQPQAILDRARLLVAPRPGVALSVPPWLAGRFELLTMAENRTSSTKVRERIAAGEDADAMLPPGVAAMIRQKNLYHANR